jgi:hypothetical protein
VLCLIVLKYVPATADLPLARTAGIICFAYAIFLALRLIQSDEAVTVDGYSELRASPVEYFGGIASGIFSALILGAVIINGSTQDIPYSQMALGMALAIAFALGSAAIAFTSLLVKVRWNRSFVEHKNGLGKLTKIAWSEVTSCRSGLKGITIFTAGQSRITFSPYHSGAQALARHAADRARRNAAAAQGVVAG